MASHWRGRADVNAGAERSAPTKFFFAGACRRAKVCHVLGRNCGRAVPARPTGSFGYRVGTVGCVCRCVGSDCASLSRLTEPSRHAARNKLGLPEDERHDGQGRIARTAGCEIAAVRD
jgi:hypothetical protein